jgi:hypothetical protein
VARWVTPEYGQAAAGSSVTAGVQGPTYQRDDLAIVSNGVLKAVARADYASKAPCFLGETKELRR